MQQMIFIADLISLFEGKYKDIKIQTCWVPSVIYSHNTYRSFITVADIIRTQGKSIISKYIERNWF
jgi:hypothetical protein